ncbi:MAG TPA: malto-oligosyltrehalose trehalohydrolase [Chloroflexota bacterium]|jgi:maltooligosyltrehalose trehalohydrolase|nr:malto-oligosyltrehalose trehalohydrolase [Chloroflexota bacterium]
MGATLTPDGTQFRVWAPSAGRVAVELSHGRTASLTRESDDGVWAVTLPGVGEGTRYRYRVDGQGPFPDPYSGSQPEGVHGPSEIVDPSAFEWHDEGWSGVGIKGLVIYQLHVGTATPEGTFDALIGQLPRLKALGVNAIEPLPVAEFPGRWNWGYDGVDLFAPTRAYGGPHALKRFIDAAHQHGLGVILDVVFNHFGPDGNYLRTFSADYFTDRYQTPWGEAINYDGPHSAHARQLVLDNVRYWLTAYHADGLRLDATHAIYDSSDRHLLAELTDAARAAVRPERQIVLIAETHENDVRYLLPVNEGGYGFDAVWADDFHHSLRRYLAGDHEGYYRDYVGTLEEVARCIEQGWLYEGQPTPSSSLEERRGTPARDRPAWQFVYVLQNHDQIGNRPFGDRLNQQIDAARFRAASALLLFLPYTPMLFMGQEFGASTPFQYFTDHNPELGKLVTEGRRKEFTAFSAFADAARREQIPDPQAESTFRASKLDLAEADRSPGDELAALYARLIALRRSDAVLLPQDRRAMEAKALSADVLAVLRWRERGSTIGGPRDADSVSARSERLLLVNFGDSAVRVDAYGGGWQTLLETGDTARVDDEAVTVAPRSASILARGAT